MRLISTASLEDGSSLPSSPSVWGSWASQPTSLSLQLECGLLPVCAEATTHYPTVEWLQILCPTRHPPKGYCWKFPVPLSQLVLPSSSGFLLPRLRSPVTTQEAIQNHTATFHSVVHFLRPRYFKRNEFHCPTTTTTLGPTHRGHLGDSS